MPVREAETVSRAAPGGSEGIAAPFTLEELLAELEQVGEGDPGATTQELCAATGWSTKKVITGLKRLRDAGKLAAGRRYVERIDGLRTMAPVYRLVK